MVNIFVYKHLMEKLSPNRATKHQLLEFHQFNEDVSATFIPNNLSGCPNIKPLNIHNVLKFIKDTNFYKTL